MPTWRPSNVWKDSLGLVGQAFQLGTVSLLLRQTRGHILGRPRAIVARVRVVSTVITVRAARVEYLHLLNEHGRHLFVAPLRSGVQLCPNSRSSLICDQ